MTPEEVLRAAAALIRERGWAKGDFEDEDGHLCAVGALGEATHWGGPYREAYKLLQRRVGGNIIGWNDSQSSVEEVLAALEGIPA